MQQEKNEIKAKIHKRKRGGEWGGRRKHEGIETK